MSDVMLSSTSNMQALSSYVHSHRTTCGDCWLDYSFQSKERSLSWQSSYSIYSRGTLSTITRFRGRQDSPVHFGTT